MRVIAQLLGVNCFLISDISFLFINKLLVSENIKSISGQKKRAIRPFLQVRFWNNQNRLPVHPVSVSGHIKDRLQQNKNHNSEDPDG